MNEARDIQHPDITAAESTGYPWFPRTVSTKVTENQAKDFCCDAFSLFWDFLCAAYPYAIAGFIDDNQDEYIEWIGG